MPWTKLDDKFHSHPKLQRARGKANAVAGLYARSLSYCSDMLTDGWVDGYWVSTIATKTEINLTTEVGLWLPVEHDDVFFITERRDSGRRKLEDVTVLMPTSGFFIEDYLHFNPSKDEVLAKRRTRSYARADVHQLSAHTPDPTQPSNPVLREVTASSPRLGPMDRLIEVCTDAKGDISKYLTRLSTELRLSESDFEWARECALGPGVDSPTAVAIGELKKRGASRMPAVTA